MNGEVTTIAVVKRPNLDSDEYMVRVFSRGRLITAENVGIGVSIDIAGPFASNAAANVVASTLLMVVAREDHEPELLLWD